MNKSYSPDIITKFIITVSFGYMLLGNEYKFFLRPLDSNTTNIVKDIFIIPTRYTEKTPGPEKGLALQKAVRILKKEIQNNNCR